MQPAVLGLARLNNFRLNYQPAALQKVREARVRIFIDDVLSTARVRVGSLTIHDILNDTPDTCEFKIDGTPPPESGMALRITLNSNTPRLLFAGTLQVDGETYEGRPAHVVYPCRGVDQSARANYYRPFGAWTNTSATNVAKELIYLYAPGFTSTGVQENLPWVTAHFDGTEPLTGCLRRVAKLIGGYFYFEDLNLHFFLDETTELPDAIDTTPKRFLHDPPIALERDDSQLRTRVYGRGHGETIEADVVPGATIIPVRDTALFTPEGGKAIAAVRADGAPTDRISYTGITPRVGGALSGPGVQPTSAPAAVATTGTGLSTGTYQYAYSWVTAAGETAPGPLATVTTGDIANPAAVPTLATSGAGYMPQQSLNPGDTVRVAISFCSDANYSLGARSDIAQSAQITVPVGNDGVHAAIVSYSCAIPGTTAAPLAMYAHVWVNRNSAGYRYETFHNINSPGAGSIGPINIYGTYTTGAPWPGPDAGARRATINSVAVGPTGTTSRKLWRTAVNTSQLKLLATIANNTATSYGTDSAADGTLGANAPTSDTSGLNPSKGQVNPGDTSMQLTSAAGFQAAGGYAKTASGDIVRYTGISGNTLTGIPASGAGSVLTALPYGDAVVPVPSLTGVSGVTTTLPVGAPVHVWVQRDDTGAQLDAAARESTATYTSTGIHEHTLTDERRGEPSLTALCDADLALFSYPITTVTYATRDVKTKSGKPITINLAQPFIHETLTIQDVTITEIDTAPGTLPRFTVTASSLRFSLEDILRRLNGLLFEER